MNGGRNPLSRFFEGWSKVELALLGISAVLFIVAVSVAILVGTLLFGDDTPTEVGNLPADDLSGPSLSLAPSVGSAGSTVTIQGQGWTPSSRVILYLVPLSPPKYAISSAIVDSDGRFSVDIIVPSDPRWLNESPVPVLAQTEDEEMSAQALLTISGPVDVSASVTPEDSADFVSGEPTTTPTPPPAGVAQLTPDTDLNVRSGPGTNYPVLGVLPYGQTAPIIGRNADSSWWLISFPSATRDSGWVIDTFVTTENTNDVPIVEAPPAPTAAPPPPATATPVPGVVITDWRGEYYSNPDLSGAPVLVRNDVAVSFDWGTGSPDANVPQDNFSARWTRSLNFSAGTYRFYLRVDDGARLWIDDSLLIDEWRDGAPRTVSREIYLPSGSHNLRVEYYERTGGAVAVLGWERIDTFPDWKAEYFNNTNLAGSPVLVRNEPSINYNWGSGSPGPGVSANDFSARWTRRANFEGGDYRFRLRHDDGIRIWVDNNVVYERWQDGDSGSVEIDRTIPGGQHDLRVDYYERTGDARIEVAWQRKDEPDNPPLAVISSPSEGQVDQSITFDGSRSRRGDSNIVKYRWDFGDGERAEGKRVEHTYEEAGTYRVRLTVEDRDGLEDDTTVKIKIEEDLTPDTPPVAVINAPTNAQVGESVSFDASPSQSADGITSYTWNFGDGSSATGVTTLHSYDSAGLYNVKLTVVDSNGLRSTANQEIRVDEKPAPVALINGPSSVKAGEAATFDASESQASANIVSYAWDFGDGATADGETIQHVFESAGTYNVSLTVTDENDLSDKTTMNVEVTGTAAPTATATKEPATATATPEVTATPTDTATVPATSEPTTEPTMEPTTEPTATATDAASPTTEPTATATESAAASPVAAISGPNEAQVGSTVSLDASLSQSSSPITGYAWNFGDGATANGMTVTHVYTAPGAYQISLTITDENDLTDTATTSIQINPNPETPAPGQSVLAVIRGPSTAMVNQTVSFDAQQSQSASPIVGYQWDFGDGTTGTGPVVTHTYTATRTYPVSLSITNQDTMTDTTSTTIEIVGTNSSN